MVKRNKDNKQKIIIIGGGPAGLSAAQTLRQSGYDGNIIIIEKREYLTYDRSLCSKILQIQQEKIRIRNKQFFDEYGIQFRTNTQVQNIDYYKKKIFTKDQCFSYDKLLIASGCKPKIPNVEGIQKINPVTIRTINDINKIKQLIFQNNVKSVTIIGGSFIGLQMASAIKSALKQNIDITVCEYFKIPFTHVLGPQVGNVIQDLHSEKGIKFQTNSQLVKVKGYKDNVTSVTIQNVQNGKTQELKSDLTIFATGVIPETQFAKGIYQDQMGAIITDPFLKTSNQNVFAAGDIASYPYWYLGQRSRVQHYNQAIYQGSIAALNMIGKYIPVDNIPFFWTRHFNTNLVYSGHAKKWDNVVIQGDLKEKKFIAFYVHENKIVAAASMGMSPAILIINEAMRLGIMPQGLSKIKNGINIEQLEQNIRKISPGCKKCQLTTFD